MTILTVEVRAASPTERRRANEASRRRGSEEKARPTFGPYFLDFAAYPDADQLLRFSKSALPVPEHFGYIWEKWQGMRSAACLVSQFNWSFPTAFRERLRARYAAGCISLSSFPRAAFAQACQRGNFGVTVPL